MTITLDPKPPSSRQTSSPEPSSPQPSSGPKTSAVMHDVLDAKTEVWRADAACSTVDGAGDLFFSEELHLIAEAKRICANCPSMAPCLESAIKRSEPAGVWGGQLFANGKILMQKRRRGRPPKVPRPDEQLLQIPIPDHLLKLIA